MPGDLLDLILIVMVIAFAVAGYRQGFIIGVLSFAGFLVGGALGAEFGPRIATSLVSGLAQQAVVAIVVVFLAAVVGQLIASGIGVAMRSRLTWRPATVLDSVGGAAVSIVSVLLIAWLIGSAVAYAPFPMISRQVNDSAVLHGVDRLMPPAAVVMFSDFRRLLASGPYPQVFGALGAEGALAVSAPNNRVLSSRALVRARDSVVKVEGVAPSCSRRIEGSGFVYAPDHVLTNAHVVAGETQGPEVFTPDGQQFPAKVVLYDPDRDIAVLYVPGLGARSLLAAHHAQTGDSAIVRIPARPALYGGGRPDRQLRAGQEPGHLSLHPGHPADLCDQGGDQARQLRRTAAGSRRPGLRHGVRGCGLGTRHRLRAHLVGGRRGRRCRCR